MLSNEQLQRWANMTPAQAPAPCVVQLASESLIVRDRLYRQAETIEALDKSLDAAKALRDTLRSAPNGTMTHEEAAFKVMVWLKDHVEPAVAAFDATLERTSKEQIANGERSENRKAE